MPPSTTLPHLPEDSPAVRLLLEPLPVWARRAPGDGRAPTTAG